MKMSQRTRRRKLNSSTEGSRIQRVLGMRSNAIVSILLLWVDGTKAWIVPTPTTLKPTERGVPGNKVLLSYPGDKNNEEPVLDDIDARVLQSMLQDEKLNLQEEQNMKRLLERGIKMKDPVAQEAKRAKAEALEEKEYASQVLQKLGSTKLWKGLRRNAADLFESAKIWVENKVERDTKLVAGLGFFAFERAIRDVKRALPATASVVDKVTPKFLLDATSSANDQQDIRSRMATPQDEIKSVTQEIKLIIQSGGEKRSGGSAPQGLQSTASSKQGKDRFLKAYQRRKQTTLKREQENLAQSSMRMAGSVLDSAYQVQRELEIEPNQPGYKTKSLREGAAQTSKFLAAGAAGFLSGAKAVAQAALTDGKTGSSGSLPATSTDGGMDATNQAFDAAMRRMSQPGENFIDATIVDVTPMEIPPWTATNAPVNTRVPGTSSYFYDPTSLTDPPQPSVTEPASRDQEDENLFFASRRAPNFQQKPPVDASFAQGSDEASPAYTPESQYVEAVWEIQTGGAGDGAPPSEIYTGRVMVAGDEEDEEDYSMDEDPQDALRKVMAEIISDDEFDDAFGQAKQVAEVEEYEEENVNPSIWTQITLRTLDVVFLVVEKVVLVRKARCIGLVLPIDGKMFSQISSSGYFRRYQAFL